MRKDYLLPFFGAALLCGMLQAGIAQGQSIRPVKDAVPLVLTVPEAVQDVAILVDIPWANVPRITPTQTGVNAETLLAAIRRPRSLPASANRAGHDETPAEKYVREHPFPWLRYFRGGPISVDIESGMRIPPGAFAIEAFTKRLLSPKENGASAELTRDDVVWHWDVPDPLREGTLYELGVGGDERYTLVRICHEKEEWLAQFDSKTGMRWQRDLSQIPGRKNEYLIHAGAASTRDGAYTVVVLSAPLEETENAATEILVLNDSGHMVSRTRLKGIFGSSLERNPSGNSFHLEGVVRYIDGKEVKVVGKSAHLLLQRNGQIKGLLVRPKEDPTPINWLTFADDDATAISTDAGFLYRLP